MTRLENCVCGEALVSIIDDFKEFTELVPQAGQRIRLKKAVQSYNVSIESMHSVTE